MELFLMLLLFFLCCSDSDYYSVVPAGAPSAPGCLAASGRQARLRQAAAGAPASLRRTRWRGFGCRYGPMRKPRLAATGTVAPLCRAVACAPGIPAKGLRDVRQRRFANRASRRCGGSLLIA
ncbi:hypothetical protein OHC95_24000, partial [Escherichia coli]